MGCGAVGGTIAARLLKAGQTPILITRNDVIAQAINGNGLTSVTPDGQWTGKATAHRDLSDVSAPFDLVLLAMKATEVKQAAMDIVDYLAPSGYVVTLQNGVVEDRVASVLGRERVVGALVGWGATMHNDGVYEMTSRGGLTIGELDGQIRPRTRQLCQTLSVVGPTTISENIYGALWSKLAINCVITTLGAITGQHLGPLLRKRPIRRLALSIVSEVLDVAQALDLAVEPVAGTLDLQRLYLPVARRTSGWAPDLVTKHVIMRIVGFKFRRLRSSMLQSLERGRRSEVDYMNGYVVLRGRENRVPTPVNEALTTMIWEIEAGIRPISPINLTELVT